MNPGHHTALYLPDLCCPAESIQLGEQLRALEPVDNFEIEESHHRLTVTHRYGDDAALQSALAELGWQSFPLAAVTEPRLPLTLTLAFAGWTAAVAEAVEWWPGIQQWHPGPIFALLSLAGSGPATFTAGWRAIKNRTANINLLMTVAIVGALLLGKWAEAAMVSFLFAVAELIESHALDRARGAIRGLMVLAPDRARVLEKGRWVELPVEQVAVGQHVWIKAGERVALDGVVTQGQSSVNEAPITGESVPIFKTSGDHVFAGSVNETGSLEFEVTANQGNTTLDRMVRAVQAAQAAQAPTQRMVDRFAAYYTPLMMLLALLAATVPPALGWLPWNRAVYQALVVLVIACPCALVLSTPVTIVSGLAFAARHGILLKGGRFLEEGARLQLLAFDKTGTLTRGHPEVTDVVSMNGHQDRAVMREAAALNQYSRHPLAAAMVRHWQRSSGAPLPVVHNYQELPGLGISGIIAGQTVPVWLGNQRLAVEQHADPLPAATTACLQQLELEGKTAVVLCDPQQVRGVIGLADTLRPGSREAVEALQRLGLRLVLLTGDNALTAREIGHQLGLTEIQSSLLPEEKLAAIDGLLRQELSVGMVGDGINDAPALARASVGIAMGSAGTATALETADVVLMRDDLRLLVDFVRLCRRGMRILRQNIALAVGLKLVFLMLALAGYATMWMAVFADMGVSLIVIANGCRLLAGPSRRLARGTTED